MSRPETIQDIDEKNVDFATVELGLIATDPALMKGYTAFIDAVQKGGAEARSEYNRVVLSRRPSTEELKDQLRVAQATWDEHKKHYETLRDVGETEYEFQRNQAERWAESEGLPFPPEHEPIRNFHQAIRRIDEVTS